MEHDPIGGQLLLQLVLILLNAVFACAEIAVISMNDAKLERMAEAGEKRAVRLQKLTKEPARFLATIQVAITLSGFLGSAFAADNFADRLVSGLTGAGLAVKASVLRPVCVVVITIILSYFTLVLGELVPKRLAQRKAEKLALGLSGLLSGIAAVLSPIVGLLTVSTNGVLRLFGIDPNEPEDPVTEEEIRMMVDVGSEKGTIDPEEKEMIQNVFEFDDLSAEEIATHRTEVDILWAEESMEEWEKTIHESRHTIYPVCGQTADEVIGVLNAKDYFRLQDPTREEVMAQVRPPYFVPVGVKADVLFRNMQRTRNRFAVVLDEFGGMRGVITITDLLEQLVGTLDEEEETDEQTPVIEKLDELTWRVSGAVDMEEFADELPVLLPEEEYETFSGWVLAEWGSVPEDGTRFEVDMEQFRVEVLDIQEHRIMKAIVHLKKEALESKDEEE